MKSLLLASLSSSFVTGEQFYHRVETINCKLSMVDGTWTYQLGTHWIGDSVSGNLIVDAALVRPNIAADLARMGIL